MARHMPAPQLESKTARLKLPIRRKPFFVTIARGIALAYRRNSSGGTWSVRASDGQGGAWLKTFATADDYEDSNGDSVLNFWQAQDKARVLARGNTSNGGDKPVMVAEAVDSYEADLEARGAAVANAKRIRFNLPDAMAGKAVALLTAKELRDWRNELVKRGSTPANADRTSRALKAAFNLAASNDQRIVNSQAWRDGLKKLPDSETARNVILPDDVVQKIVRAAYEVNHALGVFIEVLAAVGARESQLLRIEVADLQDDPIAPRLMMPGSFKGKTRRVERKPLAITSTLAATLREAAAGRAAHAKLLDRIPHLNSRFHLIADGLGLGKNVTPYSLRHSSIVRMLLAGIPVRVVASITGRPPGSAGEAV